MEKKIFVVSTIILLLDQITKLLSNLFLVLNKQLLIIKDFFYITYTNNYGAAFGFFSGKQTLLILITIMLITLIFRYMKTFKINKRNILGFSLLLGGASGNLLDRVFLGYVRDFLDFKIFGYDFPVFNISDICIFTGVLFLAYAVYKGEDNENNYRRK